MWCRRWDSNPHEVALTGFFESDKDCGMARDAVLRSAFMSLFVLLCGMLRVLVRPDCHQNSHQNHSSEAWLQGSRYWLLCWDRRLKASALGRLGIRTPSRTILVGVMAERLTLVDQ